MSKYKNQKVWLDGFTFDSKAEARRYLELRLLERVGEIRKLELQKKYVLIPKQDGERAVTYVADFVYEEAYQNGWREVVEDVKGYKTETFRLKKKLMLHMLGIRIRETRVKK